MNRRAFLTAWALAVVAVAQSPVRADDAKNPEKPARALMITQSKGFQHGSVKRQGQQLSPAEVAMKQLGETTGLFTLDASQDAAEAFTKENLKNYDIVMFYTTGDLPIEEPVWDYFLNDWLKQDGHGFVGFHSATDTYHNYQPYWDMIGGTFIGHPWNAGDTVTIAVHDAEHPAAEPFGSEFEFVDEIYWYKNWQPEKVRVLMSLNMAKTAHKEARHVPVAWVKEWGDEGGGGKIFYTNLGHNEKTWTDEKFLDSVAGGIRWILDMEEGSAKPNPEVSAAEEAKAKAAKQAG